MSTTTIYACPDHAPIGIPAQSYDDGRPACYECGRAHYAVKPYVLKTEVARRGWRMVNYQTSKPYRALGSE